MASFPLCNGAAANTLTMRVREYAHVANAKTGVTALVTGPVNRKLKSHESIVQPATSFHVVPPTHYAVVANPVHRHAETGEPVYGADGQVKCFAGEKEYRYSTTVSQVLPAFPLYPDEQLLEVKPLERLSAGEYFVIEVSKPHGVPALLNRPYVTHRETAAAYILRGPCVYYPCLDEVVARRGRVLAIPPNGTALHCRALETFVRDADADNVSGNKQREICGGTEYLYTTPGEFIPSLCEEVVGWATCYRLGKNRGVHVRAAREYVDPRPFAPGVLRRAGECFFVSCDDCSAFPLHPYDSVEREVGRLLVTKGQFCVVVVPLKDESHGEGDPSRTPQKNPLAEHDDAAGGRRRMEDKSLEGCVGRYRSRRVLTNTSFFLKPYEVLECAPRPIYVLTQDQAILVTALRNFTDDTVADGSGGDEKGMPRARGDRWLVRGPRRFIPTAEMRVVADARSGREVRDTMMLTEGQGLYVRHTRTGVVRLIAGPCSYMLDAEEELWEKPLPSHVTQHLITRRNSLVPHAEADAHETNDSGDFSSAGWYHENDPVQLLRQGTTVHGVVYDVPNRGVTQLFNYRTHETRTIFGPDRVLLEPDEGFTVVSLSGSPWDPNQPNTCLPKQANYITALYLHLGPSNMTDVMQVETCDHVRLSLQLCYDWYFDIADGDAAAANKCFKVNDFVGNTCSFIAGRVRAAVASLPFEQFHKRSSQVLREAVFGTDPQTGAPLSELRFTTNNLVVTTVDIQVMQVRDERALRGLRKSVEMAIEIATHAQEVKAQQTASSHEQDARGLLERKQMSDQVANEEQRAILLQTEQEVLSILSSSKATAMAAAMSEAATVESNAAVAAATLRTQREVLVNSTLAEVQRRRKAALKEQEARMANEVADYTAALEAIRHDLMEAVVAALGPDTIAEMAKAGPELQASLLKGMGLEGYLVTDGSTPLNLFQTANGLLGGGVEGDACKPVSRA